MVSGSAMPISWFNKKKQKTDKEMWLKKKINSSVSFQMLQNRALPTDMY